VERAARLAKADLVTGMVGEFPELQGMIGGYLARAQGEPNAVADAVRDHYKPVGQGDEVPTAPVTVAVSLADKLDTLACFFLIKERPTGSKDPYALRRAAIAAVSIILRFPLKAKLAAVFDELWEPVARSIGASERRKQDQAASEVREAGGTSVFVGAMFARGFALRDGYKTQHDQNSFQLLDFFADRLKVQQREAGVRHDLIDAVFALGGEDDLVRLLARVQALQSFVETADGRDLLAGYKRAANILKKEDWTGPEIMSSPEEQGMPQTGEEDPLVLVEEPGMAEAIGEMASGQSGADLPQEQALIAALDAAESEARAAVEREDFTAAMAALARLRAPIDAFFDNVTVNDPDSAKREQRLNLLLRFRDAVNAVADFSKIEG
jgi:glycyl-tRNA synthetase beta chain